MPVILNHQAHLTAAADFAALAPWEFAYDCDVVGLIDPVTGETRVQSWFELASRWAAVAGAALVLIIFWRMFSKQKPEAR